MFYDKTLFGEEHLLNYHGFGKKVFMSMENIFKGPLRPFSYQRLNDLRGPVGGATEVTNAPVDRNLHPFPPHAFSGISPRWPPCLPTAPGIQHLRQRAVT